MKLNTTMNAIILLVGAILLSSHPAYADVTVVYKMTSRDGSATQTIYYADKQHIRLDMGSAGQRKVSMMKLGDKVYSITGKVVQDLSQLSEMMASMGMAKKKSHEAQAPIKFEDTGKTETIAGIRGKVYRFVDNGKRHEVVLGQNRDLQDAALGMVEITKAATGMMPFGPSSRIQQDASIKSMALLRLDDRVRLQSINTRTVPAATFKLPSKPQEMGGMGGFMKGIYGH